MKNTVIIYDRTDSTSLMNKNKAKQENPRAIVIEVSNTEKVSEALEGKNNNVLLFADVDKRRLKGDKVVEEKVVSEKEPKKKTTKPKKTKSKDKK